MRKDETSFDDYVLSDDYKLASLEMNMIKNLESTTRWLYLGADATNPGFARIGMTMGDLRSRSYGSVNANYYLFCAFKCRHDLSELELKQIETAILDEFQNRYLNDDGSTKRLSFYESGYLSDCFSNVNFAEFFADLHYEIYENYRNSFVICGMDDGAGGVDGEFVDCIFNDKVRNKDDYRRLIIQY